MLVGWGLTSYLLAAIVVRKADVSGVSVSVSGTLEGTPEQLTAFELVVTAASGNCETLRELLALAERTCQGDLDAATGGARARKNRDRFGTDCVTRALDRVSRGGGRS